MADKDYKNKINKMREFSKDILFDSLYNDTRVNSSIHSSKRDGKNIDVDKFKKSLLYSIGKLRKKADDSSIKNSYIRNEIKKLSKKTGVSVGQSQKVINVYLKFYCLSKGLPVKVIKELDCPLDSTTMKGKRRMKNLLNMDEYVSWQDKFEKESRTRLLKDMEYDRKRIKKIKHFQHNDLHIP